MNWSSVFSLPAAGTCFGDHTHGEWYGAVLCFSFLVAHWGVCACQGWGAGVWSGWAERRKDMPGIIMRGRLAVWAWKWFDAHAPYGALSWVLYPSELLSHGSGEWALILNPDLLSPEFFPQLWFCWGLFALGWTFCIEFHLTQVLSHYLVLEKNKSEGWPSPQQQKAPMSEHREAMTLAL